MQAVELMKCILESMRPHFRQDRIFDLFQSHLISNLEMPGRHTISNTILFKGDSDRDWSREYRLFSKSQWDAKGCMNVLLGEGLQLLSADTSFIPVAIDLTSLRKHGKRIPYTNYQVDPLSPPFSKGLMWGQRFLHMSLLIPMHQHGLPARGIPIRLEMAPFVKKPGKKAKEEDWKVYKEEKKRQNANIQSMNLVRDLKKTCERLSNRKLLVIGDGGFCNRHCFKYLPSSVDLLTRCRKDAQLCFRNEDGRAFYGSKKFTPEGVRKDAEIPFHSTKAFYGGDWRDIKYKECRQLFWQRGAQKRPLRLIVINPVPYRKTGSGNDNYRDPCYLLTTDLTSSVEELIQAYFNRIEIEQNHRDMKNNLGFGNAQVWSAVAAERHPQMIMIGYSLLLLSMLKACGPKRTTEQYIPPPIWYRGRLRPTIEDMKRKLRQELAANPSWRECFGIWQPWESVTPNLVA